MTKATKKLPHFGGQGPHRYEGGVCVYCGEKDPNRPPYLDEPEASSAPDAHLKPWEVGWSQKREGPL